MALGDTKKNLRSRSGPEGKFQVRRREADIDSKGSMQSDLRETDKNGDP